jgi:hypothetical protein
MGEELISQPSPKIIILSRPDIYDSNNALRSYATIYGFRPHGENYHLFQLLGK